MNKVSYVNIIILCFSILISVFVCEMLLRVVTIPGIEMRCDSEFDPDTYLYRYAPNTVIIKWNVHNELIKRTVNSEGFVDREHAIEKPSGTYRIGFFGDSYVEATQMSLENTFFRIIEQNLKPFNVETLAFGINGHGTLHSYLKSKKYADYFNLDMVVYVFCENDLGDQMKEIKAANTLPYAEVMNGHLVIDTRSVALQCKNSRWRKFKNFFYNHSVLFQTIYKRLLLLKEHGLQILINKNEMQMSTKTDTKTPVPRMGDLPSSWPAPYKMKAKQLGELVITQWFNETAQHNRKFVILYVPRQTEWHKKTEDQDSWKPWLEHVCQKLHIDFIDPSESFRKFAQTGAQIYEDHFTPIGHQAFADSFVNWFTTRIKLK